MVDRCRLVRTGLGRPERRRPLAQRQVSRLIAMSPRRTSEQQGKNGREPPVNLRKLAEKSSLTDWLLAAFTLVLAPSGLYQFIILVNQLGVMRKYERPLMIL